MPEMKFINTTPWGKGTNGMIEFRDGDPERRYSVVDDLVVRSFKVDISRNTAVLTCLDQNKDLIHLEFNGLDKTLYNPENTYQKYNAHSRAINLTIIDQIIYDPDNVESEMVVTIVGFGWAIALHAKTLSIRTGPLSE